jgi:hypothetical protein
VTDVGYEHLNRHDLRHTGLTWMTDAGVPVHVDGLGRVNRGSADRCCDARADSPIRSQPMLLWSVSVPSALGFGVLAHVTG